MKRIENSILIGQFFGEWTIVSISPSPTYNKKVYCRCSCGTEKDVFWNNLKYGKTKSCGSAIHGRKGRELSGQRFGELTVIEALEKRTQAGNLVWQCQCSCGVLLEVSSRRLVREEVKSCGCLRWRKMLGQRFGQLTVRAALPKEKDRNYWLCECSCGNYKKVYQGNLLNGHTQSCGCLKKQEYRTLVEGTYIEHIASSKRYKNNTSGYKGGSLIKGKWQAYLTLKGKRYNLGDYSNLEDAIKARQSGVRARLWFKEHGIEIEKKKLHHLSRHDLIQLLTLTDKGMEEIVKQKRETQTVQVSNFLRSDLSFEEALDFLISHSELLRSPIILDQNKYMLGYNHEEIRKFLSREYRKIEVS